MAREAARPRRACGQHEPGLSEQDYPAVAARDAAPQTPISVIRNRPAAEEMTNDISRPLVEFIHRHLRTMDHVEVLLCLYRASDVRSLASIAAETRLPDARAKTVVQDLVGTGLIVASDALFRRVRVDESDSILAELAAAYNSRPVALVRAIYSRPSAIQSFADAFRLRKDKPEGEDQ